MDIIKSFNNNSIRVVLVDDNPYFASMDVCHILEIKNPSQAVSHLDSDDLITSEVVDSIGRRKKITFINESGLYQLIFRSRKESAIKFKKWVTHEVLPSIRKTGKYSIPESVKNISTKNRNTLTDEWQKHGIKKPAEFIHLTLQEYKFLNFEKRKRKKDLTKGELLTLSALESMEAVKLFYDSEISGFDKCQKSILNTANQVKQISGA